jgi:hypothetical protein
MQLIIPLVRHRLPLLVALLKFPIHYRHPRCLLYFVQSCSRNLSFLTVIQNDKVLLRAKKVGHQISVSFEKFDVVQALLSFFDTILADILKIDFILLFYFSKCPLLLIKVDFDWDFALNIHYALIYNHSLQPTILT